MSLKLKTILGIALIEAVLLVILIITMMNFIRDSNYEALEKRASTTSTLFATTTKDAVLSFDLASLESFVNEVMQNADLVYARVLSADGVLFAEAGDISHLVGQQFKKDIGVAQVNDNIFDTSADIIEGGVVYGRVQLGIDIGSINQAISKLNRWSTILATSEMLLVALFSFILGSYLTGQLAVLRSAARTIAKGDYNVQIEVKTRDEIGEVSSAFNLMAQNLGKVSADRDQYELDLLQLNQTLEERVQKRTSELNEKHSELAKAYASLQDTQAQLLQSEKMASVGLLAAGVAHEINNPVSFVMSNLNTLVEYSQVYNDAIKKFQHYATLNSDEERAECLASINDWLEDEDFEFIQDDLNELLTDSTQGTVRIKDIVAGLKDFSHVDQTDQYTLSSINSCITTTLKMLQGEFKNKCEIVTNLSEIPDTYCAAGQINQVFLNLLVNAGHAIESQGVIEIESYLQEGDIYVRIKDNGKGIEAEDIGKLFDPFYTTKPIGEGTGLGLAISYGIMTDHEGAIEVESEVGVGTTFILRLPVVTEAKPEPS